MNIISINHLQISFICLLYNYTTPQKSNYFGSLTQASTTSLGIGPDGKDVYIPFRDLLPMLEPNDIEFDGKFFLKTQDTVPQVISLSLSF